MIDLYFEEAPCGTLFKPGMSSFGLINPARLLLFELSFDILFFSSKVAPGGTTNISTASLTILIWAQFNSIQII